MYGQVCYRQGPWTLSGGRRVQGFGLLRWKRAKVYVNQGRRKPSSRIRRSLVSHEVASRVVKGRVARKASRFLNWCRDKLDGCMTDRTSRGRTYGGEVVEPVDQVYGKCLARQTFEDRGRPGVCNAKGSDKHIMADADGVHAARSIQYRLCSAVELAEGQELGRQPVGNGAEARSLPWRQVVSRIVWSAVRGSSALGRTRTRTK